MHDRRLIDLRNAPQDAPLRERKAETRTLVSITALMVWNSGQMLARIREPASLYSLDNKYRGPSWLACT